MFCKECGTQLSENDKFCPSCGFKVEHTSELSVNLVSDNNVDNPISNDQVSATSNESNKSNGLKNILIILLICLLVGGAAIAGYIMLFQNGGSFNKKTSAEAITYALNNMTDMSGYNFNFNMELESDVDGEDVSVTLSALSVVDVKNDLISLNISANSMDESINIPAYLDLANDDILYFSIPMISEDWYKLPLSSYDDSDLSLKSLGNLSFKVEDYLQNDEFIEKVSSDDPDIDKYVLHYTRDVIEKLLEDDNGSYDISEVERLGLADGFDVQLFINNKDNYLTKFSFDFSGRTIEDTYFKKFIFSFEVTNVNSIDSIVIPSEALSAVDFNEMLDDTTETY